MITSMSPLARGCFPVCCYHHIVGETTDDSQGYTSLNRMQSIVQPTAMNTNENMLICGQFYTSRLTRKLTSFYLSSSYRCGQFFRD